MFCWGDCKHRFVREGNMMQLSTALTMMLAHFCGCTPVLEQPTSSVLPRLEPLNAVLNCIGAKKTIVWHGAYTGGTSPKPLQLWGPTGLSALTRRRPKHLHSDLVRYGQTRTKKTYTGTKALKGSQTYCMAFAKAVASLATMWVTETGPSRVFASGLPVTM